MRVRDHKELEVVVDKRHIVSNSECLSADGAELIREPIELNIESFETKDTLI